jgi:DNA-binding MarR family transcriptional regulator
VAKGSVQKRATARAPRDDLAASAQAIRRILRALRLAAQDTQRSAGVSSAQLFALSALADGAPASLAQLAARTLTDRSSVSGVVNRLVERRLVSRRAAADDRRRAAVRITAAGRAVLARAPRSPMQLLVAGIEALPAARRRALARELEALVGAMGLENEPAEMLFEETTTARRR